MALRVRELDDVTSGEKRRGPRTELAFLFSTDTILTEVCLSLVLHLQGHCLPDFILLCFLLLLSRSPRKISNTK